jgi:cysteine desulfurase
MLTLGSGKLYGPRGVAVLYKKTGVLIEPILHGGTQEYGLRPGTEDVTPLVGFAVALEHLETHRAAEYIRLSALRDVFIQAVGRAIPDAVVNGAGRHDAVPHIVNVSIPNIDSEYVMLALDHTGVSISTKSVCVEQKGDALSHVVHALHASSSAERWRASTTLRFSFGMHTTIEDIHYAAEALTDVVTRFYSHGRS